MKYCKSIPLGKAGATGIILGTSDIQIIKTLCISLTNSSPQRFDTLLLLYVNQLRYKWEGA